MHSPPVDGCFGGSAVPAAGPRLRPPGLTAPEVQALLRAAGGCVALASCMQQARRRKTALERQVADLAILRVAPGPMRRGLRIARRHTDRYPGAVSSEN